MTVVYVSDVLENVLAASRTRQSVRQFCQIVLHGVPESVRPSLRQCLHYIAGKCMGYPAVWLVEQGLGLSETLLIKRLEQASGPLFISLTTSIADDFLDREDKMTPGHMMLIYLLIFEALRRPHWFCGSQERIFYEEVYPLIPGFVSENSTKKLVPATKNLSKNANRSGRRIGAFHETIAHAMSACVLDQDRQRDLVRLAGRFGDWCSHLDDIFDIEVDIEAGANITLPMLYLCQHSNSLAHAIEARDAQACLEVIQSESFLQHLITDIRVRLLSVRDQAHESGFSQLTEKLTDAEMRIERNILNFRRVIDADHVLRPKVLVN